LPVDSLIHDSEVKDLAWVISNPPLIQGEINHCNWTTSTFWQHEAACFDSAIKNNNANPSKLHQLITEQKDHRLGHRFETLLAFWFKNSERYELITQNLQVRDSERTIGEFDFIVKDKKAGQVQHWEVACKFYLGIGDTQDIENWHGPMLKDRLAKKYEQMQTSQSILSKHPAAQTSLKALNIKIDQTICVMKGRLFYPIEQATKLAPDLISPNHQQGWWARPSAFKQHFMDIDLVWLALRKDQWLSPQLIQPNEKCYTTYELVQSAVTGSFPPLCIAGFDSKDLQNEVTRGFLVPENWAHNLTTVS